MSGDKPLRIVCTECPAVAVVHHQEWFAASRRTSLWVECHGVHIWGSLSQECTENGRTATMQEVENNPQDVLGRHDELCAQLVRLVTRIDMQQRYLRASGTNVVSGWPNPGESFETCERVAGAFMDMAVKYRDGVIE